MKNFSDKMFNRNGLSAIVLFAASSFVSTGVDIALFSSLSFLLKDILSTSLALTALSAGCARIVSSLLNFFLNRRYVFKSADSIKPSLIKYYSLAVPILAAQTFATEGAFSLLHIGITATGVRTAVYAAVMLLIFLINFQIQHLWVFGKKRIIGNDSIN